MTIVTAISTSFNIFAQLAFAVEPQDAAPNVVITPAIQVKITDLAGTTLTSFTGNVTVAIGVNPGTPSAGVLAGTLTVAAVAGVATFSDLSINMAGSGYTLVASATDMSDKSSLSFDVIEAANIFVHVAVNTYVSLSWSGELRATFDSTGKAYADSIVDACLGDTIVSHLPKTGLGLRTYYAWDRLTGVLAATVLSTTFDAAYTASTKGPFITEYNATRFQLFPLSGLVAHCQLANTSLGITDTGGLPSSGEGGIIGGFGGESIRIFLQTGGPTNVWHLILKDSLTGLTTLDINLGDSSGAGGNQRAAMNSTRIFHSDDTASGSAASFSVRNRTTGAFIQTVNLFTPSPDAAGNTLWKFIVCDESNLLCVAADKASSPTTFIAKLYALPTLSVTDISTAFNSNVPISYLANLIFNTISVINRTF